MMDSIFRRQAGAMHCKNDGGFTLIEVLIAIFVLAVGLLAMANVQVGGMKSTDDGYLRTQANIAATDMADRMRANIAGVNANLYANVTGAIPSPVPPSCTGVACTSGGIASRDIYEWLTSLSDPTQINLPGGTGSVTCIDNNTADGDPCTDGSPHTITVSWRGRFGPGSYSVTFQP
ncbi:MAG TPA: type IV pilus modification protein PilV [Mariprofundaceae bacterium]|nr:type IV pilus modification protein PilV [Mariprofundaceae bacterium]